MEVAYPVCELGDGDEEPCHNVAASILLSYNIHSWYEVVMIILHHSWYLVSHIIEVQVFMN